MGTVAELTSIRGMRVASALGVVIGDAAARRIQSGVASLCDLVLASWVLEVDPVEAVVDYARSTVDVSEDPTGSRCA